jgi:phosphoglycerate dehydrogenase-like enzyme
MNGMPRILINFEFPDKWLNVLKEKYGGFDFAVSTDKEEVLAYLENTEILITFFKCSRQMLDAAPRLKWIQAISAGVDYMPLDEVARRHIILTNGRGIHRVHMSEFALASMIILARSLHVVFRNQMGKKWDRSVPQGEINDSVLGIIGLGDIGKEIARKASFLGMHVIGVKRSPEPLEFVEEVYGPRDMGKVFEKSDYIINLLPSTAATERIIDRNYFDLMKKSACFINIGRGKTVNEPDLIATLRDGKIRAMLSDVYFEEPLPEDSPLWDLENVMLTPHICGMSPRYTERAVEIIDHNLEVYVHNKGEMINLVDLETGY